MIAWNGAEALDADAGRLRAVMTDIRRGDGPDGGDVARHARKRVPAMPVVCMSGDSGADQASEGAPRSVMVPDPIAVAQIITTPSTRLNETDAL